MTAAPQSRSSEWLEGADWALFERQFREPYRITVGLIEWLAALGLVQSGGSCKVLYVGAGMGANLLHLSRRLPGNQFVGLELNPECVQRGRERLAGLAAADECDLRQGDLYAMPADYQGAFDGVLTLATLSWLPEFEAAAQCLTDLRPKWIAATSLFYDGPVDATIQTRDYSRPLPGQPWTEKFYNVYSLSRVREFFAARGYGQFEAKPFEIDLDLQRPEHGGMGTYTEKLADGRRLQISGPLMMPWYFIVAQRVN